MKTSAQDPATLRIDDLILDPARRQVLRDRKPLKISGLTYELLVALAEAAPALLTHEELAERVWKGRPVTPETLAQRVKMLREALSDDARHPRYIELVRGHGYRLLTEPGLVKAAEPLRRRRWAMFFALALVALVVAGIAFWPTEKEIATLSVAVLPFEDRSPNGDQRYLSDGLAEELIHQLSSLGDLEVASRNDAFFFREQGGSVRSIGEQLAVRAILEGSVLLVDDNLRVRVQLVDVASGFNIWSADFNRKLEDLIEIQREVARSVAGALGVSLGVGDANTFQGAGTSNVDAYLAFMRRELERAIELDPDYAAAWGLRGLTIASTMWSSRPEKAPELKREAQRHTARALALNPNAADALAEHATVTYATNAWIQAEELYVKAKALKDSPYIVNHYANMMMRVGRSSRALTQYELVDRLQRTRQMATGFRVNVHIAKRRVDSARANLALLRPEFNAFLSFIIELNFGTPDSIRAAINAMPAQGPAYSEFFEPLQSLFGDQTEVLEWLNALALDPDRWWPSKYELIALMAAYYGDADVAWRAFERELRYTTIRMGSLWFPVLAEVRALPEFRQFLVDINLVDYWREYDWPDYCRPLGEEDFVCDL